jgi:hypothetical protein
VQELLQRIETLEAENSRLQARVDELEAPKTAAQKHIRESTRKQLINDLREAQLSGNGPKEISIGCGDNMMMNINDLIIDDPDEDPLCLVLNLSGPHMASKLEIACDGSFPE